MESELLSLHPKTEFTRREFIVSMLATGFALAVQPVAAQTIVTDQQGLTAGEIKVAVADGSIPAYCAMPASGSGFPVVLVVQEIFGVHEHIKDVCRRFAKLGYMAIAPELYARQGDASKLASPAEIMSQIESRVSDEQVLSDLDACVAWAKASNKADVAKLGITGFCWGGRITWLYAAHNPQVKAAVAWYGRLVGQTGPLKPQNPIDIAPTLKVPVLGLYGGADQGIPQESVEKMRAALKAAGNPSEIIVYPDVPHAFNADYRPSYRKEAAEDGWKRLQAWFKKYGVV